MTNVAKNIPFELFAPYNEQVVLLGSWNKWKPIPMQGGDDGVWRVEVPLKDGSYQYKFQLVSRSFFANGQTVTISDPIGVEVTLDNRENSVVHIKKGKRVITSYKWKHDDVPLPDNNQLIIYEMHVGDFRGGLGDSRSDAGTFDGVVEKLDYLADLGINAIELMPINEFPGHHSWGYAQRSIYAVENSYGTPDELCRLVDECHARGIRVIHDAVFNHMEMEAPLTKIDYEYWFYKDNPDEPGLRFGPKFNYEHHDDNLDVWPARRHVIDAMHFAMKEFHMDGIRFDCTRAIRYFDLLDWFHDEMHHYINFKPFITIAEHIPQDPTIAGTDGPMDAAWHDNFYRQMICTVLGVPLDGRDPFNTTEVLRLLDGRGDGFRSPQNTVIYLNTHDEERLMLRLGSVARIFDEAAFRRNKLGASLLFTSPGYPMIWMGEEFGQPTPKTLEAQPLHWQLLQNDRNKGLFNHYKSLIHLRKNNSALYSDNFEVVADIPYRGILAFKRWNDQGNVVVVAANLRDQFGGEVILNDAGLEDGVWHEAVYNYDVHVNGGQLVDTLAESEVKIYIKQV